MILRVRRYTLFEQFSTGNRMVTSELYPMDMLIHGSELWQWLRGWWNIGTLGRFSRRYDLKNPSTTVHAE